MSSYEIKVCAQREQRPPLATADVTLEQPIPDFSRCQGRIFLVAHRGMQTDDLQSVGDTMLRPQQYLPRVRQGAIMHYITGVLTVIT